MRRQLFLMGLALAAPASAQLPGLRQRPAQPALPVQSPLDILRAEFAAQAGGTTVYFAAGSAQLTPQARLILGGQAAWLRQYPAVAVRMEGRGDTTDTRNHALALGAKRANAARDYLILMGIPAAQVTAMSWGKERPGAPSVTATIVQ